LLILVYHFLMNRLQRLIQYLHLWYFITWIHQLSLTFCVSNQSNKQNKSDNNAVNKKRRFLLFFTCNFFFNISLRFNDLPFILLKLLDWLFQLLYLILQCLILLNQFILSHFFSLLSNLYNNQKINFSLFHFVLIHSFICTSTFS